MKVEYTLASKTLEGVIAEAKRAEALGYDGVSSGETSHDPFFRLVLAGEHTSRLTLCTSVLIAFPRSPMVVAYEAWDVQEFTKGRLLLGLGTQIKAHIERRFSVAWDSPGPRLREYIAALRHIWDCWQNGTKLDFAGDFYQFSLMNPLFTPEPIEHPRIPIYISALNPYNLRLSGEVCDGLRMHSFNTPRYAREVILPHVEAGLSKAGRTFDDFDLVGQGFYIAGANEEEIEEQRPAMRRRISFYGSTPAYRGVMSLHGWTEEAVEMHRLSKQGKWDEMAELVTDEMFDTFVTVGRYDDIADRFEERWGGVVSRLTFNPPPGADDASIAGVVAAFRG